MGAKILGLLFLAFVSVATKGDTILSFSALFGASGFGFQRDSIQLNIAIDPLLGQEGSPRLFEGVYTTADIGRTLTASSGKDFDAFVASLTNGVHEKLAIRSEWSGVSVEEPIVLWLNSSDSRVDLQGYFIDRVSLTINNLTFDPTVSIPIGSVEADVTLKVEGRGGPIPPGVGVFGPSDPSAVPLPSVAMAGIGLLGLKALRRRPRCA